MTETIIKRRVFGSINGADVPSFTLDSNTGATLEVCSYGASLTRFWMPEPNGTRTNLTYGYKDLQGYLTDPYFIGATVGRVANRISKGRFELGGKSIQLELNDPPHHLHGGPGGWFKRVWDSEISTWQGKPSVIFSLESPDGDCGYPGKVNARVIYQLHDNDLHIVMTATTDSETIINLANHAYWNLRGSGTILDHELCLACDAYTPGNPTVPEGEVLPVDGTALDFRKKKRMGKQLPANQGAPTGYDHNLLVNQENTEGLVPVAEVFEPNSGRTMKLLSNQPAVQLYTGNYLDNKRLGLGGPLEQYGAFCLETQAVPNAINLPSFRNQVLLSPGATYHHEMLFRFSLPQA